MFVVTAKHFIVAATQTGIGLFKARSHEVDAGVLFSVNATNVMNVYRGRGRVRVILQYRACTDIVCIAQTVVRVMMRSSRYEAPQTVLFAPWIG